MLWIVALLLIAVFSCALIWCIRHFFLRRSNQEDGLALKAVRDPVRTILVIENVVAWFLTLHSYFSEVQDLRKSLGQSG